MDSFIGYFQCLTDFFVAAFAHPSEMGGRGWRAFRNGFLLVILSLMAFKFYWLLTLPPSYPYDRYGGLVVGTMLLLNCIAYGFRWSRHTTVILRILAWMWIIVGFYYLLHLSHIWFPIH